MLEDISDSHEEKSQISSTSLRDENASKPEPPDKHQLDVAMPLRRNIRDTFKAIEIDTSDLAPRRVAPAGRRSIPVTNVSTSQEPSKEHTQAKSRPVTKKSASARKSRRRARVARTKEDDRDLAESATKPKKASHTARRSNKASAVMRRLSQVLFMLLYLKNSGVVHSLSLF